VIERIKKVVGVAALLVFGAAFTVALAYWTIKSWWDTPVFNLAFWAFMRAGGGEPRNQRAVNNGVRIACGQPIED